MERKASREKRRREEVNEKFEQLQQVLEEAETTSGLEPPAPTEGQTAANACINGRRVEVLSRTIVVLNKLLRDRLAAAAASSCSSSSSSSSSPPSCSSSIAISESGGVVEEETPASLAASASAAAAAAAAVAAAPTAAAAAAAAAPTASTTAVPVPHCTSGSCCTRSVEGTAACGTPAATAVATTTAATTQEATVPPPALVHHMALPGHGHAPVSVPAGFPGLPAGMQAGIAHSMSGHGMPGHGQPIFIAVPVYMPQGQGMGPPEGSIQSGAPPASAAVTAAATAAAASAATAAAAASAAVATAAAPAPSSAAAGPEVVSSGAPPAKPESTLSVAGKEAWAVHPSMGFQSMMTLQMPQFVTQALSTEEGDEKPTHAVCA